MNVPDKEEWMAKLMRQDFEASLPQRLRRASAVKLQHFIPDHWFGAAAPECAGMQIAGFFYGAISVAQAYVEALSRWLAKHHDVPVGKDICERCQRLHRKGILSAVARDAALTILDDRNDFHHLNKNVEQDFQTLEARAEQCINLLHALESEVFEHSITQAGKIAPANPDYWPSDGPGLVKVHLRQRW